jgi:hypothetical protein
MTRLISAAQNHRVMDLVGGAWLRAMPSGVGRALP